MNSQYMIYFCNRREDPSIPHTHKLTFIKQHNFLILTSRENYLWFYNAIILLYNKFSSKLLKKRWSNNLSYHGTTGAESITLMFLSEVTHQTSEKSLYVTGLSFYKIWDRSQFAQTYYGKSKHVYDIWRPSTPHYKFIHQNSLIWEMLIRTDHRSQRIRRIIIQTKIYFGNVYLSESQTKSSYWNEC